MEPNSQIAAVAPEQVGDAVAVEVALADDGPVAGHGAVGAGLLRLQAVHQPARDGATVAIAPGNIAQAVTVEVVSGGGGCDEHPGRAEAAVVVISAEDGGVAVAGQCDGPALVGGSHRSGAGELGLLGPRRPAAGEHPGRAGTAVVVIPAHKRGVAVGGQRDRTALRRVAGSADADQLGLLGPGTATAGEHPRCAIAVVVWPAYDGGVAVARQRDGPALEDVASRAGVHQLGLLAPRRAVPREHPRRAEIRAVERPAQDGGVAVAGERGGVALLSVAPDARADQLGLLIPHSAAAGEHPRCADTAAVEIPPHESGVARGGHRGGLTLAGVPGGAGPDQLGSVLRELLRQGRLRRPNQRRANQSRRAKRRRVSCNRPRADMTADTCKRMREESVDWVIHVTRRRRATSARLHVPPPTLCV